MAVPKNVTDIGIVLHNVVFGAWKSEVPPGLYIKHFFGLRYVGGGVGCGCRIMPVNCFFLCCSAKNYCYTLYDEKTNDKSQEADTLHLPLYTLLHNFC